MSTAPAAPRTVPRVPCLAEDEARAAHRLATRVFVDHYWRETCIDCGPGEYCPEGQRLSDAADDAGKRWEMAEAKATRMAGA